MAGESETQDVIIQIDAETSCTTSEVNWLESIMKGQSANNKKRWQIFHKVPEIIRGLESNKGCFDPLVVSIGPYHHGKPELKLMEEHKAEMARQLYSGDTQIAKAMYNKLKSVVRDARPCYAEDSTKEIDEEEFNRMMFLDGSFVLQFIYCCVYGEHKDLKMKQQTEASVRRDLFLLENQLPYQVLKQLMSFHKVDDICEEMFTLFIEDMLTGKKKRVDKPQIMPSELEDEPAHFLAFFRSQLIDTYSIQRRFEYGSFPKRSATQLMAAGITFRPNESFELTNINFKSACLELPKITIDDDTKSILLNMIAYENCPDGPDDLGVTSYVCFMDSLIDDVEDVRLLQSRGIVYNFLANDQQVADLFNQIATNAVPNPIVYGQVVYLVGRYYQNKLKVWLAKWLKNNFSFIAFFAGTSALILSIIQTYFAAYPAERQ